MSKKYNYSGAGFIGMNIVQNLWPKGGVMILRGYADNFF